MAPMHGPTYGHGPIPFMAMAHSIHGHGPIPFMAKTPIHGQGSIAVAPRRYISGVAKPGRHPRVDFARIDRIRESKVTGVRGGSGGSLPSIGAIMEHHTYAYI